MLFSFGLLIAFGGWEEISHGREALDYLHSHPAPCLIVLDLRMPRMSGWQFRQEQRRDPALAGIPVVVSPGEQDSTSPELGEVRFCPKGSNPGKLVEMIRSMCA